MDGGENSALTSVSPSRLLLCEQYVGSEVTNHLQSEPELPAIEQF
jgi:hypothetical protein